MRFFFVAPEASLDGDLPLVKWLGFFHLLGGKNGGNRILNIKCPVLRNVVPPGDWLSVKTTNY